MPDPETPVGPHPTNRRLLLRAGLLAALLGGEDLGAASAAEPAASPQLLTTLKKQVAYYEKTLQHGAPEDLLKNFYAGDILFIGPGAGVTVGPAEALKVLKTIMAQHNTLQATIVKLVPLSPTSSLTLVKQVVSGQELKSIFVWRLDAGVWRVVCDMYAPGAFGL